jgi:hypothetical protein
MSGVVPGIHVLLWQLHKKGIDKAGTLKKSRPSRFGRSDDLLYG